MSLIVAHVEEDLGERITLDADLITHSESHGVVPGIDDVVGEIHVDGDQRSCEHAEACQEKEDFDVGEGGVEGHIRTEGPEDLAA